MLDNETKRRIDTARDILVGKVPDPKSQVEQITIALVYKFMDDMDKESVEMGGKASFFTGEFKRFAWSKIFDPRIGGHEMLNLYSEAIDKMNVNPNIPQLFRDIFKNAYLPYRDPETLKLFLKTINEFTYEHSERLGDAFEYLLSVLGSQGDAGQFRTPRHIIDFMVQVVNPQKHETILDPACGTAGFLISAYKHIVRENTSLNHRSANGNNRGDLLTTDERKKLLTNFKGYDISPDMVRLSLVNLYLHGFVQPQILEYDTLTSEDRWNEYADVILANPPFMSPKGGIKPHKKFSVPSNRSEVLFVDYIAEHLRPTGRAAVIVPEGIIFQSAGAYKLLRKMLVENHLFAVVSLPAGLFNPYSGVKTSILFMDRQLAKKCDSILFVKIANDGYGLGAQRREQAGSDLPDAVNVISDYMKSARTGKLDSFNVEEKPCGALLVKKEKLAENGEYNLTGERYRIIKSKGHQKWPMVKLGDVSSLEYGLTASAEETGNIRFIRITDINDNGLLSENDPKYLSLDDKTGAYLLNEGDLLVARTGATYGKTLYFDKREPAVFASYLIRIKFPEKKVLPKYYWAFTRSEKYWNQANSLMSGGGQPQFNGNALKQISFPLPPLEVQREIVAEIEGYKKIIDGARQIVENWKPQIEIDPAWPLVKLGAVCEIYGGGTPSRSNEEYWGGLIPWISSKYFSNEHKIIGFEAITEEGLKNSSSKIAPKGSTILITRVSVGKFAIADKDYAINQDLTALIPKENNLDNQYLWLISELVANNIKKSATGIGVVGVTRDFVFNQEIPRPSIEVQQQIVAKIEAERNVIDGCRKLIAIYEAKIKQVIDKVWEE